MSGSVFHALCYHFVWSTKGRFPVLSGGRREWIVERVRSESRKRGGTVFACNAMPDHVHLVVAVPPTLAVCHFIGQVKGASSFGFNREFAPPTEKVLSWQDGYGAFSLRLAGRAEVVRYVEDQERIHANRETIPFAEDCGEA